MSQTEENSTPTTAAPFAEPPRLGRTVVGLGFVSLLTDISSEMAYTQVPLFLTNVLGAPAWAVGIIEGIAESAASLMKLISGWLSDRSGRRKPLAVAGYAFGALSKPLIALATVWPFVLLCRFLDRLGKGLRTTPRDALIAETTPKELRGRAFGLHRTMDTTGAVLGPLLGVWFVSHISPNPRHLFLFAGLPGLIAVLTLLFLVKETRRPKPDTTASPPLSAALFRWRNLHPTYRRFLFAALIFNLGNFSDAFLILRAKSLGFGATETLWLYAAFNVVEALLGYAAGRLSDRVGRKILILCGYALFALVYLGFALAHTKSAIWILFLLYGGYYTLTQGVQRAFAADLADPAQRATQIGAYHTVVGLALLPASLVAGILFGWNPAAPFLVGAVLALASVGILATLPRPDAQ